MHRRGNKPSATRNLHVGVGVRHDDVSVSINNLPIHARVMTALLLEDRERARPGQVSVTSTRDGRRENWTAILQEVWPSVPASRSPPKFPRAITPLRRRILRPRE